MNGVLTCVVCGITGREEGFDVYDGESVCAEGDNDYLCANQVRQWVAIMSLKRREQIYKRMIKKVKAFLVEVEAE